MVPFIMFNFPLILLSIELIIPPEISVVPATSIFPIFPPSIVIVTLPAYPLMVSISALFLTIRFALELLSKLTKLTCPPSTFIIPELLSNIPFE